MIAHDLFRGNSHGVLSYARHTTPTLDRRDLSAALIAVLIASARADVLTRLAATNPATDPTGIRRLANYLRVFRTKPTTSLLAPDQPAGAWDDTDTSTVPIRFPRSDEAARLAAPHWPVRRDRVVHRRRGDCQVSGSGAHSVVTVR
ncbi:hypothetical protein [Pseudofrankia sp. BMG5.36]|uniref:hypothetical protein n=1 Tax=Pseudofrankia sp. BMG5.36 TaxID=1834512 RepID=UPI0008D91BF1|nr:hypothetical protein [Pseudofrankia sp. BMG5.36]OHV52725.1 hypothetical protein BCD48_44875 [Pseudofrankia sp. BMG5.36]